MAVDLKEGMALYVRIDDKAGERDETEQDALDSMNYCQGALSLGRDLWRSGSRMR